MEEIKLSEEYKLILKELDSVIIDVESIVVRGRKALTKLRTLKNNIPTLKTSVTDIVVDTTLKYFDLTIDEMRSKSRSIKDSDSLGARQIIMTMLKDKTKLSLQKIGLVVDRNHATVLHAIGAMSNYKDTNDFRWDQYCEIEKKVDLLIENYNIKSIG